MAVVSTTELHRLSTAEDAKADLALGKIASFTQMGMHP